MIFGWDLGGAHIKLVVLDREGRLSRVLQVRHCAEIRPKDAVLAGPRFIRTCTD